MQIQVEQPPYIIGEVGACHSGKLETALELIAMASESGCHAVKFQVYDAERLSRRRNAPQLVEKYRRYELPLSWLPDLQEAAHEAELDLILSVYDQGNLARCHQMADWLKVASFEAQDICLLDACANTGKKLLISSGLSDESDLAKLRVFQFEEKNEVGILHCISVYPASPHELNLAVIRTHKLNGFSDHSGNRITGALAVAYGAKILEVHIRLTDTPEDNPDFRHALNPSKLTDYIRMACDAAVMGGSGIRTVTESEKANLPYRVKA